MMLFFKKNYEEICFFEKNYQEGGLKSINSFYQIFAWEKKNKDSSRLSWRSDISSRIFKKKDTFSEEEEEEEDGFAEHSSE